MFKTSRCRPVFLPSQKSMIHKRSISFTCHSAETQSTYQQENHLYKTEAGHLIIRMPHLNTQYVHHYVFYNTEVQGVLVTRNLKYTILGKPGASR
jgi:hypothetical protein